MSLDREAGGHYHELEADPKSNAGQVEVHGVGLRKWLWKWLFGRWAEEQQLFMLLKKRSQSIPGNMISFPRFEC